MPSFFCRRHHKLERRGGVGQTASNLCQVWDGILKVGGDPGKSPQWKDHGGKQCLFTLKSPPWLCKFVVVVV